MAALSDTEREALWAAFMQLLSAEGIECSITKQDLRAAFNALDDFVDSAAFKTSANTAIPQPARSALTTDVKAWMLVKVIERRYLTGADS